MANRRENKFQRDLIKEIKNRFPGSIVLKNDPTYCQGIPDLLILYEDHWAALECKRSSKEGPRPNQEYYVRRMNQMSYASFIYPENKEEVLYGMEEALQSQRTACDYVPESAFLAERRRREIRRTG